MHAGVTPSEEDVVTPPPVAAAAAAQAAAQAAIAADAIVILRGHLRGALLPSRASPGLLLTTKQSPQVRQPEAGWTSAEISSAAYACEELPVATLTREISLRESTTLDRICAGIFSQGGVTASTVDTLMEVQAA